MASINISGDVSSELNKMMNDCLNGKTSIFKLFKFLDDNNIKVELCRIEREKKQSSSDDFVAEYEIDKDEFEKCIFNAIDYFKRLINDYGNPEEDDIRYAKAATLYLSMMMLGRTYRQKAKEGDEKYNIPNFTPENILEFIDFLNLPTAKIKAALERGKSNYYKTKIYKDFDDFESSMKDVFGIEDVWNPPEKIPEWFINVRDSLYAKFHPEDVFDVDEDEWNEFKEWKAKKDKKSSASSKNGIDPHGHGRYAFRVGDNKCLTIPIDDIIGDNIEESFENQCRHIVNEIINKFSPIMSGNALKYFENMYKSNDNNFIIRLKALYIFIESLKNKGLICFIDANNNTGTITCDPISNTRKDVKEALTKIIDEFSKLDSEETSTKKSSTAKKRVSTSKKDEITTPKKTKSSASSKKE